MYVSGIAQGCAPASAGGEPAQACGGESAGGAQCADVEAAIAAIVEASPPLTAAQRARLAVLLQGGQG